MAIDIHVQDEQVVVEIAQGEINTGKPPVLQEISVTKDGSYTPDFGVDGFSKVDVRVLPTDMLDGLADGWDVMFYDEQKRGLASYSIKKGHTINAPVYDCKNWQNADGATIVFPYTPTGDVIFYALNATYADQMYEFYGVDKAIYPYLFIRYKNTAPAWFLLCFAKEVRSDRYFTDVMCFNKYQATIALDITSVDTFLADVQSTYPTVSSESYTNDGLSINASYYYYMNKATYDELTGFEGITVNFLDE